MFPQLFRISTITGDDPQLGQNLRKEIPVFIENFRDFDFKLTKMAKTRLLGPNSFNTSEDILQALNFIKNKFQLRNFVDLNRELK